MIRFLKDFWADKRGATTIEYVLIIVVVSLGIIGGAQSIRGSLDGMFEGVRDSFEEQS